MEEPALSRAGLDFTPLEDRGSEPRHSAPLPGVFSASDRKFCLPTELFFSGTPYLDLEVDPGPGTLDDPTMDRVLMGLECSLAGP